MPADSRAARDRRLVWALTAALALVIVLLIAALARPGSNDGAPGSPSRGAGDAAASERAGAEDAARAPELPDLSRRIESDPTALGAVDAPVVLVEFADYRCPFCGVFARDTLPSIVADYVDRGQLRIEWRDVPIFGEQSVNAAVAARAAGQQGRFWEYSAAIFAYPGSDHQALPRERLLAIAAEAGVPELGTFEAALDDPALAAAVSADLAEAQALGVQSTPAFVIGRTPLMGAQPVEAFRAAIETELSRAAG